MWNINEIIIDNVLLITADIGCAAINKSGVDKKINRLQVF